MEAKILVLGSLEGRLEEGLKKAGAIHAKTTFAFALVTGNLFGPVDGDGTVARLLSGELKVPLPTYFTVGTHPLPAQLIERIEREEDICENLHYLAKRSVTRTLEGLQIVTLGGRLDESIIGGLSKERHLPFHTVGDAASLRAANRADILLTSVWPAGVYRDSKIALSTEEQAVISQSQEVAMLCAALKPRYHLSASPADFFYEREPFLHPPQDGVEAMSVTRFISLAPFGNASKAKAMYAFNLKTQDSATTVPPGCTMSPFIPKGVKRRADDWDGDNVRPRRAGPRRPGRRYDEPRPGPDSCFFCLSNPHLETHMVVAIGDEAYLSTAKGPLPGSDFFSSAGLTFPGHQLIIPLAHEPTARAIGAEGAVTFAEMSRFRDAVQAMVAAQSACKLGVVGWEISRSRNIHLHWQLVPAPIELLRADIVEAGFRVEAENRHYPPFVSQPLGSGLEESADFFRLWLWSAKDSDVQGKELVMRLDDSVRFDLQFPRRVMAKLLHLEDRTLWHDVVQSTEEETSDAQKFRAAFKPWDFTLPESE